MMPASDYRIDKSEVLRYLGYHGQVIDQSLDALIDRISDECLKSAEPKYHYQVFGLEETGGGHTLTGTDVLLRGKDINWHLAGAGSCAVMAATLGFQVERAMLRLGQRSATEEVVFNAACTALIEAVADRCEAEIMDYAREFGLTTNYRYSPGYGDFPLGQQVEILAVIDARRKLGITLTESYLMLPKKSVTALIGLFPEETYGKHSASCENCRNYVNCEYRKVGGSCGR